VLSTLSVTHHINTNTVYGCTFASQGIANIQWNAVMKLQ
jgi:hypothetical protein